MSWEQKATPIESLEKPDWTSKATPVTSGWEQKATPVETDWTSKATPEAVEPPKERPSQFQPILSEESIREIAKKRGVDPDNLVAFSGLFGSYTEAANPIINAANTAGLAASVIDDLYALGWGKKAAAKITKQFADNPDAWEAAVDDIREETEARKSGARIAAEMAAPVSLALAPLKAFSKAGKVASLVGKTAKALDAPQSALLGAAGKYLGEAPTRFLTKATGLAEAAPKVANVLEKGAHGAAAGAAAGALGSAAMVRGDEDWKDVGYKVGYGAGTGLTVGGGLGILMGALTKRAPSVSPEAMKAAENLAKKSAGEINPSLTTETLAKFKQDKDIAKASVLQKEVSGGYLKEPVTEAERAEIVSSMKDPSKLEKPGILEKKVAKLRRDKDLAKLEIDPKEYSADVQKVAGLATSEKLEYGRSGSIQDLKQYQFQRNNDEVAVAKLFQDSMPAIRALEDADLSRERGQIITKEGKDTFAIGRKLSDRFTLFSEVAERLGVPIDTLLGKISNANQVKTQTFLKQLEKNLIGEKGSVVDAARSVGGSENLGKLNELMEGKALTMENLREVKPDATNTELLALGQYQQGFKDVVSLAEKTSGIKIPALNEGTVANAKDLVYIPQHLKPLDEIPSAWMKFVNKLDAEGINWKAPETLDLQNPLVQDLFKGIERTTGDKALVKTRDGKVEIKRQFYDRVMGLDNNKTNEGTVFDAGTAAASAQKQEAGLLKKRTDTIPSFLRDWEPLRIMQRYQKQVAKHITLRPVMDELVSYRNLAVLKGDQKSVNIIDSLMQDLQGAKEGSIAKDIASKVEKTRGNLRRTLEDPKASFVDKTSARIVLGGGEMLETLSGFMYPNVLSSLRTATQNMVQTVYQTVPEVGVLNGTQLWARSMGNFMKDAATGNVGKRLESWGDAPFDRNLQLEAFRKGIVESGLTADAKRKLLVSVEKLNNASMVLFKTGETFNTYMANAMAEKLVGGLNLEKAGKNKFLQSMSPGYRTEVQIALAKGDKDRATRLVQEYLIQKTIFRFDKSTQAEAASYMGRLFAAFTKYPTATYGDLRWTYIRKDMSKWDKGLYLTKKYLTPIGLGLVANQLAFDSAGGPDMKEDNSWKHELASMLLGQRGFMGPAQILSVWDIASEGWRGPPAISTAYQLAKGTVKTVGSLADDSRDDMNWKPVGSAAGQAAATYLPLMNFVRLIGSEVPTMWHAFTGHDIDFVGHVVDRGTTKQHPMKRLLTPED